MQYLSHMCISYARAHIGIRNVINFKGKTAKEIYEKISSTLNDSYPSYESVRF